VYVAQYELRSISKVMFGWGWNCDTGLFYMGKFEDSSGNQYDASEFYPHEKGVGKGVCSLRIVLDDGSYFRPGGSKIITGYKGTLAEYGLSLDKYNSYSPQFAYSKV